MNMMHSANRKSILVGHIESWSRRQRSVMLTFVSGYEVLDVFGNVLVEMQLANIERLDYGTVVQHQQSGVTPHLHTKYHNQWKLHHIHTLYSFVDRQSVMYKLFFFLILILYCFSAIVGTAVGNVLYSYVCIQ